MSYDPDATTDVLETLTTEVTDGLVHILRQTSGRRGQGAASIDAMGTRWGVTSRLVAALIAPALLSGGCYSWSPLPVGRLRGLQPEGVQQAAAERAEREHMLVEPAINPPPDQVRISLQGGEVVQLQRPFVITEVEPGQFRVLDRSTPLRTISMAQISRVQLAQPNALGTGGLLLLIPIAALLAGGIYALATTPFSD